VNASLVQAALTNLLAELIDGAAPYGCWVINREDLGLLGQLEQVSAADASRRPMPGITTIAAHANHLRYALELLNRWAGGEENPFAAADWPASWSVSQVSADEWRGLRNELAAQAHAWLQTAGEPREWDEIALTGALASAPHLAYHLGAIRQLVAATQGQES